MSWTIFKELLGLHRWYLTESTYAWRAFTTYWIFHDWMIQKGVAGLRIIFIKNFVVDYFQRSSWPTWLILDWKYLCMKGFYYILDFPWLNDPKGRGRTWNNFDKKLCHGLFSKKLLAYMVDTWLKVLMHEGLLLHSGFSMIEWSKRLWQYLK